MGSIKTFLDNKKGFTLMEVMIVVAIIGSLAAIAIANMINYRNKTYCPVAEQDAQNVRFAIEDYFSVPPRAKLPDKTELKLAVYNGINNVTISEPTGNLNESIKIDIIDSTGRCPRGGIFTLYMGAIGADNGWHN